MNARRELRYRPERRWAIRTAPFAEPIGHVVAETAPRPSELPDWLRLVVVPSLRFAGWSWTP